MLTPYENPDELFDLIMAHYPDIFHEDLETRSKAAVQALTDFIFAAPSILEADTHSRYYYSNVTWASSWSLKSLFRLTTKETSALCITGSL